MKNNNHFNEPELLNQSGKMNLRETGKWAQFLSILGFISLGLLLLVSIFAGSLMSSLSLFGGNDYGGGAIGGLFFVIYFLIIIAIYFYPLLMLYKFGNAINASIKTNNTVQFNESLSYLKRFFKFIGILTIIMIALYLLIFIFAALLGSI